MAMVRAPNPAPSTVDPLPKQYRDEREKKVAEAAAVLVEVNGWNYPYAVRQIRKVAGDYGDLREALQSLRHDRIPMSNGDFKEVANGNRHERRSERR